MLINIKHYHHQYQTLIFDRNYGFVVTDKSVNQLMSSIHCLQNCYDYKFSMRCMAEYIGIKSRFPYVNGNFKMIPMPLNTKDDLNRTWILKHHLDGYYYVNRETTDLIFKDFQYPFRMQERMSYIENRIRDVEKLKHFIDTIIAKAHNCVSLEDALNQSLFASINGKTFLGLHNYRDARMQIECAKKLGYKVTMDEAMKIVKAIKHDHS